MRKWNLQSLWRSRYFREAKDRTIVDLFLNSGFSSGGLAPRCVNWTSCAVLPGFSYRWWGLLFASVSALNYGVPGVKTQLYRRFRTQCIVPEIRLSGHVFWFGSQFQAKSHDFQHPQGISNRQLTISIMVILCLVANHMQSTIF